MTAPATPDTAPAPRTVAALALVTAGLAAVVAWLRLDPVARGTLWAEDGRVFVADALARGLGENLLRPYDGYLHAVPRLLAQLVVTVVPVEQVALAVTAASCAAAGATAAAVLVCSGAVVRRTWVRVALASLTVLVPSLPVEVLGNLANLHWLLLWLTPWLLLHRPRTRTGLVAAGVLGLATGLTEVQAVYFVPLVLHRWRDRRGWPARAGLLVGLAAQTWTMLAAPRRPATGEAAGVRNVVHGYLADVVLPLWLGTPELVTDVLRAGGWAVAIVALVPSGAALLLAVRRGTGDVRLAAVVLPAASLVTWVVAVVVNRPPWDWSRPQADDGVLEMVRYAPAAQMMLAAGLVLGASLVGRSWWQRAVAASVGAVMVVGVVLAWRPPTTQRAQGPVWSEQVPRAEEVCGRGALQAVVPVAPEGWGSPVLCDALVPDS